MKIFVQNETVKSLLLIVAVAGLLFILQHIGIAEASGGGGMVWEGPLTKIQESISGPVAKIVCLIAICIAGFSLAHGHGGAMAQKLCMIVIGCAVALGGASVMSSLFGSGAGLGF